MPLTDEEKKKFLHELFPDQDTCDRIIEQVVVGKRPANTSKTSQYPYYKRHLAERTRQWADEMMGPPKINKVLRYDVWCADNAMSANTLYNMVYQSRRYLLDNMDTPSYKYLAWKEATTLNRIAGLGVTIEWKLGATGEQRPTAQDVILTEVAPLWKRKMLDWIESDETKPFIQENLALNEEQIGEIKNMLSGISSIRFVIRSECIKLIRVSL